MSTISRVWHTALKPGCVTNFDMLFLVMVFISSVDEIQFMLIICMGSIAIGIDVYTPNKIEEQKQSKNTESNQNYYKVELM